MKILGSLLILASSVIASYIYENRKKEEIATLGEAIKLIEYIKNQIIYFSYPVKGILKNFKTENIQIKNIMNEGCFTLGNKELDTKVKECFANLGKGYKNEQLQSLDYVLIWLKKAEAQANQCFAQKTKVFSSVAVFVSCCFVILFS